MACMHGCCRYYVCQVFKTKLKFHFNQERLLILFRLVGDQWHGMACVERSFKQCMVGVATCAYSGTCLGQSPELGGHSHTWASPRIAANTNKVLHVLDLVLATCLIRPSIFLAHGWLLWQVPVYNAWTVCVWINTCIDVILLTFLNCQKCSTDSYLSDHMRAKFELALPTLLKFLGHDDGNTMYLAFFNCRDVRDWVCMWLSVSLT